jgi:outer membrane biosynthesis protein TonB
MGKALEQLTSTQNLFKAIGVMSTLSASAIVLYTQLIAYVAQWQDAITIIVNYICGDANSNLTTVVDAANIILQATNEQVQPTITQDQPDGNNTDDQETDDDNEPNVSEEGGARKRKKQVKTRKPKQVKPSAKSVKTPKPNKTKPAAKPVKTPKPKQTKKI